MSRALEARVSEMMQEQELLRRRIKEAEQRFDERLDSMAERLESVEQGTFRMTDRPPFPIPKFPRNLIEMGYEPPVARR